MPRKSHRHHRLGAPNEMLWDRSNMSTGNRTMKQMEYEGDDGRKKQTTRKEEQMKEKKKNKSRTTEESK
jgi:hypothetical protein